MSKEQVQVYRTLLPRKINLTLLVIFNLCLLISSCNNNGINNPINVICNSVYTHSEITSNLRYFDKIVFQDDMHLTVLLKQVDPEFGITYNSYDWNIHSESAVMLNNRVAKFPLDCDCAAKVIDESPDGNWQVIETITINESGEYHNQLWLVSKDKKYELFDARNWAWSSDEKYFSYTWATDGPIGILNLLDLESLDLAWSSSNNIEETNNFPIGFLEPWPLSYNITFSPEDTAYWYRDWFPRSQNKIYVYDPIEQWGKIEQFENIRSVIWSDWHEQLMFVESDDNYITISSEDEMVSAKIPNDLYLEIDGKGLESELTHTNFQVSPKGSFVVFPKNSSIYVLECQDE